MKSFTNYFEIVSVCKDYSEGFSLLSTLMQVYMLMFLAYKIFVLPFSHKALLSEIYRLEEDRLKQSKKNTFGNISLSLNKYPVSSTAKGFVICS